MLKGQRGLWQKEGSTYLYAFQSVLLCKSAVLQKKKELRGQKTMLEENVVHEVTKKSKN